MDIHLQFFYFSKFCSQAMTKPRDTPMVADF